MTNLRNVVAIGAAVAYAVVCNLASAQDDLDSLLNDLESESKKKPAAKVAEAPAAPAPAEAAEPEAAAPKAEEKPVVAEAAPAPEAAPVEVKAEAPAAPKAVTDKEVDEINNLLNDLAAEVDEKPVEGAEDTAAKPVAAAKAKAPAPVVAPPRKDAELISNVIATEKLRRQSLDAQATREINAARESMTSKEFGEAVKHYGFALKLLNDRPDSRNLRRECEQGIAEGLYRAALEEDSIGRRDRAVKLMEKALEMRHPKAAEELEDWRADASAVKVAADSQDGKHRMNEDDFKLKREQIRKHLRRSRQYLAMREIEKALEECEVVLVNDPYNQEAIRLRKAIQFKRQTILQQERVAARDGMIADVDEAWRPVYAVNAAQLNESAAETVKTQVGEDPERSIEQEIEARMKAMRLPTIQLKPPATIIEAVDFFRQASKDYDRPDIPLEKRGFNFVLKTPQGALKAQQPAAEESSDDFSASADAGDAAPGNGLAPIPNITASDITFYEALKLVCDSVDYKFIVRGPIVMVMQKDMSTAELLSRKYDVLEAFLERMTSASSDVKEMKSQGFGGGNRQQEESEENQERDWKAFFEQMGVKWPEGSSIMYIKTLGKLYVRNTRENLAEFEKVLQEMGSQPKLIEIETRFVEVAQEDLNSLGFEWILNNDYSLAAGHGLGKFLGLKSTAKSQGKYADKRTITQVLTPNPNNGDLSGENTYTLGGKTYSPEALTGMGFTADPDGSGRYTRTTTVPRHGYGSINGIGGDNSRYTTGNRYLSTVGNHISGESGSVNDQFMRVNAFLGSADLSMILHMLAQRSDTDLLSAPKVVTKSGENAVIKVVTEYIYPQDYDVQLQSSSSGSSGSSGSSQSAILAVVEPQNFTMREVGVILDVTPTYSEANGGTIDLELKPQVVDEPVWKNYGMKIPFTGNSSMQSFQGVGDIFNGVLSIFNSLGETVDDATRKAFADQTLQSASTAIDSLGASSSITYYDAPMEQPFFHVRSIDSKVSITPGSTVVMGGLITEARKAMDDKIPFLGDLPFIGRLFRSHSEQTIKRNLLIFVTGRLITPSGRELKMNEETVDEAEVKPAPSVAAE